MWDRLALATGSRDPAIRLFLTLLTAYLLSVVYRLQFRRQSPSVQHAYFIITGLSLNYFNYGWDTYHTIIGILFAYVVCKFIGGTILSVILAFIFYLTYICVGFYYTASTEYDLKWTLPQCILMLRMIALIWDLYDGRTVKPEKMDAKTKETALTECPSLAEIAAATYFYGSFLVGPQFALTRFRNFVEGRYEPPTITEEESWGRVKTSIGRLCLGLTYMAAHLVLYPLYPAEYFMTSQFGEKSMIWKYLITIYWLRAIMFRYQSAWLIAESSCILAGLAYNGRGTNGAVRWDAVRNMRMVKFEVGSSFQSVIESFNYNTNLWAAKYIFKRLKFLGNRTASHVLTLLFLALWHGFHSGYYMCFGFEFICVMCEKKASTYFGRIRKFQTLCRSPEFLFPMWLIQKGLVLGGCGFGFLPFIMLMFERWIQAYKNLYFIGYIMVITTLAIDKFIWRRKVDLGILRMLV